MHFVSVKWQKIAPNSGHVDVRRQSYVMEDQLERLPDTPEVVLSAFDHVRDISGQDWLACQSLYMWIMDMVW